MATMLDYDQAHQYVEDQQKQGRNVFWEGWDIIIWKPSRSGYFTKQGRFLDGRWGKAIRIRPNKGGKWFIR